MDTGCRLLDTGQVDPDRADCHFPQHNNLEIDIVSGTAPLGSGFINRPYARRLQFSTFKAPLIEGGRDYYGFWLFKNQGGIDDSDVQWSQSSLKGGATGQSG